MGSLSSLIVEREIATMAQVEEAIARQVLYGGDLATNLLEILGPDREGALTYALADFPALVAAAPKGLFMVGPAVLELEGDEGRGTQPLCFVEQTQHDMRIGWYDDTYRRTAGGWRLHTRKMTFLRRSGARDSGRAHDPTRPEPSAKSGG